MLLLFFIIVDSLVPVKVSPLSKVLAKHISMVWLLFIGDSMVFDKGPCLCKRLVTDITMARLLFIVDSIVRDKVSLTVNCLSKASRWNGFSCTIK